MKSCEARKEGRMSVRPVFSAADIERTLRRMGHEIVESIPDPSTLVLM